MCLGNHVTVVFWYYSNYSSLYNWLICLMQWNKNRNLFFFVQCIVQIPSHRTLRELIHEEQTCDSLNLMSGHDMSPERSCSMYSKTRYMLHDNREVIKPSNFTMFGWSSLRRIVISRAINLTLSGSKLSNRTFFKATTRPVSSSRARNTVLYVPCPICWSS